MVEGRKKAKRKVAKRRPRRTARGDVVRWRKAHIMGGILSALCNGLTLPELGRPAQRQDVVQAHRDEVLEQLAVDACDIFEATSREAHRRELDR